MFWLVVEVAAIARDEAADAVVKCRMWSRALHHVEWFGPLHLGVG